ncbi:putative bacteriophage protein [Klebsiella pneumoniae]|nr:putative bacteriophage protein [Klebsiella pneumoniae]
MATPDWEAIESAYRAGVLSLRDIGDKYGVTEGAIRKRAKKFDWVRKASTQVRKNGTQSGTQKNKARTSEKPASSGRTQKSTQSKAEPPPDTKPIRGMRTDPPTNPFQTGNQHALKHGGYGRRMLLSDATTEDAQMLTLDDELFWLRAANLTAAENIGRWKTELEVANAKVAKDIHNLILSAQTAMHRNTARIESLEYTKASIIKQRADVTYREAATDKVSLEADRLRRDAGIDDGNGERDLNDFYSDIQTDAESGPA